jgi:hypothetical protein
MDQNRRADRIPFVTDGELPATNRQLTLRHGRHPTEPLRTIAILLCAPHAPVIASATRQSWWLGRAPRAQVFALVRTAPVGACIWATTDADFCSLTDLVLAPARLSVRSGCGPPGAVGYGTSDAAVCRMTCAASEATQKPLRTSSSASRVTLAT